MGLLLSTYPEMGSLGINVCILFYSILSRNLGCHWGTTDEFVTTSFRLVLFSAALVELVKSIPVHSLILSSHLFFCLPLFFFLSLCPVGLSFSKPEDLETWPNHPSFCFLTRVRSLSNSPVASWIFLQTSSLVTWPYTKCSITSGCISSQKPVLFFLTLQSKSMIHRHTEIWN